MLRLFTAFVMLALSAGAGFGQQQQQQSPTEMALQINSVIGAWAQTITQQSRMIDDLQKQVAAKDARIRELQPKSEEKKN